MVYLPCSQRFRPLMTVVARTSIDPERTALALLAAGLPAQTCYHACADSMQYTIRAVPDEIDRALRQRARRESKSLNAVVIDALARGLALNAAPVRHTDLDHLVGTWQEDPQFDRAVAEFDRIDDESWQ